MGNRNDVTVISETVAAKRRQIFPDFWALSPELGRYPGILGGSVGPSWCLSS